MACNPSIRYGIHPETGYCPGFVATLLWETTTREEEEGEVVGVGGGGGDEKARLCIVLSVNVLYDYVKEWCQIFN